MGHVESVMMLISREFGLMRPLCCISAIVLGPKRAVDMSKKL